MQMHREHVSEPPYGYFWWLTPEATSRGHLRAIGVRLPGEQLVVVINSAWPAPGSEHRKRATAYIDAIRAAAKTRLASGTQLTAPYTHDHGNPRWCSRIQCAALHHDRH